jgi:hypothetical protein
MYGRSLPVPVESFQRSTLLVLDDYYVGCGAPAATPRQKSSYEISRSHSAHM